MDAVAPAANVGAHAPSGTISSAPNEGRTRDLVARCILESGPLTAADLSGRLGVSPAAIRRHLDALVGDGILQEVEPRGPARRRSRGRPARAYRVTEAGRSRFTQAYDDLAKTALHYLRSTGGSTAVRDFADHRAIALADVLRDHLGTSAQSVPDTAARVTLVSESLTAQGYAANVEPAGHGLQICQHHCPVAHVATEFPELCEAETRVLADVLGTYVQRLATIAHGDGVCTTHVPLPTNSLPEPGPAPTPSPHSHAGRHQ